MTCRPFRLAGFAGLALALVAVLPAVAAPNAAAQACRSDFTKFCSDVEPGGGRIVECLKQHEPELMPVCRSAVDQLGDCGKEVRKICGDASGRDALRACIQTHANEFSPACRAAAPAH